MSINKSDFNKRTGNVWGKNGILIAFLILVITGIAIYFFGSKKSQPVDEDRLIEVHFKDSTLQEEMDSREYDDD